MNGIQASPLLTGLCVCAVWMSFPALLDTLEVIQALLLPPTDPFTILEPRDQDIGEFYEVHERRKTDFEATNLWKSLSGASTDVCNEFWIIEWSVSLLSEVKIIKKLKFFDGK